VIAADELAKLWKEHAAALALVCRMRSSHAEDCVQEAFIRLATQDPVPDDPVAWLARVARNAAISRARSENRRRKREEQSAENRGPWFDNATDASYESITSEEAQAALAQLDEATREIVVAHLWGGLTFRQIAEAFGVSHSSAHRAYTTAMEQLRRRLSSHVDNHVGFEPDKQAN
jgi:RNA polymerase sigma factor (sigma-70 family)